MKSTLVALTALALVAGCSSTGGRSTGLFGTLAGQLAGEMMGNASAEAPRETPGFTAEAVAANPQDYMVVNVPSVGVSEPARLHTKNGPRETWQAQGGATLAFEDGIMVATRGLIDDLLAMSSAGVRPALAAGGGSYQRVIEGLDTQDQLTTAVLDCALVAEGREEVDLGLRKVDLRKFTETCQNSAVAFQNAYWLDGQGRILQSRQYVSVPVGYVYANSL